MRISIVWCAQDTETRGAPPIKRVIQLLAGGTTPDAVPIYKHHWQKDFHSLINAQLTFASGATQRLSNYLVFRNAQIIPHYIAQYGKHCRNRRSTLEVIT